jgi:hypothetical protein
MWVSSIGDHGMFLPGDDNTNAIRHLISSSKNLDCAVAFLGQKAERLLSETTSGGRIVCNLGSGGTNPNAIKQLLATGAFDIRNHPSLHAKVYIGQNGAIVSSANLSANGLGLEAEELTGWIEAGYKVTSQQELQSIHKWFSELWINSTEITNEDIRVAMEAWKKRQIVRPATHSHESLLQVLRENPGALQNRNIYMVISTDSMSEEAVQTLKNIKKKKKYGINVDAYENWAELPENSCFIDFYVGPRGGFRYYGLFKSPEKRILISFDNEDGEEETLYLCNKQENFIGYMMSEEDIALLKSKAAELLKSNIGVGDANGKYIPLIDARKILFSESPS